jgi:gluconokinase
MIVVIMGAAGSGKTTVGQRLAAALGWPFFDGDDFHPPASVAKMASGVPLDDDDREPWLARLRELIDEHASAGASAVIACSALRRRYRERLLAGCSEARLVYLEADAALLAQRLAARAGHFFPAALLESQLAALEPPEDAIAIHAGQPVADIVSAVIEALGEALGEASGQAARKPPGRPRA